VSLTAFTPCGFIPNGQTGSLMPLRGWFWPFTGGSQQLPPGFFPGGMNGTVYPCAVTNRDFFKLYWRLHRVEVAINVNWVVVNDPEPPLPGEFTTRFFANKWFRYGQTQHFTSNDEADLPTRNIPNLDFNDPDFAEVTFEGNINPLADPTFSGSTFRLFFRNSSAAQGGSEAGLAFILFFQTAGGFLTTYKSDLSEDYLATSIDCTFMGRPFTLYAYLQTPESNNNFEGTVTIGPTEDDEGDWYEYDGLFSPETGEPFNF
jgi:hypothetical protein